MKILFFSDNFPPERNAPAYRTYEHAVEWVKMGHEVTVITCFPNFPAGKIFAGFKNYPWKQEDVGGVKVIRVWTFMSRNKGFIRRTLDFLSFAFWGTFVGLFFKSDIVVTTSPQFFTNLCGFFYKCLRRKPWVLELRDLWPKSLLAVGLLRNKKVYRLLERLELLFYKFSDKVVVVHKSFMHDLMSRKVPREKIIHVPNGVNLDFWKESDHKEGFELSPLLKGKRIITYAGTIGLAHNLSFVITAFRKYVLKNRDDIALVIVGDGAEKERIEKIVHAEKINNIFIHPGLDKDSLKSLLLQSDVSIANLKKTPIFKEVVPSKIFESAACGKPILLGVEGEAKEILEKYNAGIAYDPDSGESLFKAIEDIFKNEEGYNGYREGALKLAKDYDRKALARSMAEQVFPHST